MRPTERIRVQIPVCHPCNSSLEARFETPSIAALTRLFDARGEVTLEQGEVSVVGEWFAKTLLLLAHPAARYSHRHIDIAAVRVADDELPPREYYSWLVDGSAPPSGLSVWLHRADEASEQAPLHRIPLPTLTADGVTIDFIEFQVAFHGICVTLVVHPGWPITHPLEEVGQSVRLLPDPHRRLKLDELPVLWPKVVAWTRCRVTLKPGMLSSPNLPPLRASKEMFAVLPEVLHLVDNWSG